MWTAAFSPISGNSRKMEIVRFSAHGAAVTGYLHEDHDRLVAHKIRPVVIICAGGAYQWLSPREKDPAALAFFSMGYQAFLLEYSTGEQAGKLRPLRELAETVRKIRFSAEQLEPANPRDNNLLY